MRPDLARRFEEKMGRSVQEFFGEYEYRYPKSGRLVKEEIFPMHDIEKVLVGPLAVEEVQHAVGKKS